ncbi:hypothetical protein VTL71DRAFT_4762 [Oculimacula yallundae]|uniref:Carbohydrate-binding module family 1 protein n=1 Tax=Oculimacula yallundae TaxID=86028 RepID=A0ABR4C5A0_9HELO
MRFPTVFVSSVLFLSGLVASQITITRTITVDPIEVTETAKPTTKKPPTTIKTTTKPTSTPEVTKTFYITVTTTTTARPHPPPPPPPPTTTKKPSTTAPIVTPGPDVNSSKLCPVPEYYNCYVSRSKDEWGRDACTQCAKGLTCTSWSKYYSQCLTATDGW